MSRILLITSLSTLLFSYHWLAFVYKSSSSEKSISVKTEGIVMPYSTMPVKPPVDTLKDGVIKTTALQDVLFATNEDCDLYINEESKGIISKSAHKYIKLAPGRYVYKAKSKSIPDELKESFNVKEGEPNEIFIDLLYFIDEVNLQKQNLKKTNAAENQPVASNEKKAMTPKPEEKKPEESKGVGAGIVNTILSNMISVKGGSFVMGNNKAPSEDEAEHPVTVNSVLFSKYEVTQEQWENLMGYNPSLNKGCSTCPVENVSWEEVMKFIRKLNVLSNKRFRLPTEAEWEYVARIGGKAEIEKEGGPEEYIKKTAWYFANSDKKTHPVGQKQPNAAGIYDLLGNVAEWCSDWYGPNYYKEDNNQINPEGPPLGKEKVVRGGTFNDYSGDRFRPSLRNKLKPTGKSGDIGFRLVLETGLAL